jgi:predicted lipase
MPTFDPTATAWHCHNARILADASDLAYESEAKILAAAPAALGMAGAQCRYFQKIDTQGFLIADGEKIILAFRGSERPTSLDGVLDWLRNANIPTVPFSDYADSAPASTKIHHGFADGLRDVLGKITRHLAELDPESTRTLWITGHSLGGALAVAAALQFTFDSRHRRTISGLYTYGQPRVANPALCTALDHALGTRYQRVVNHLDIITRLPSRGIFKTYDHAGQVVYLRADGTADFTGQDWANALANPITEIFLSVLHLHPNFQEIVTDHFLVNDTQTGYRDRLAHLCP